MLVYDSGVVMYDAWWPHLGNWGLADLGEVKKRRVNYYVATASTVAEKATFIRSEPLTEAEFRCTDPTFRSLSRNLCASSHGGGSSQNQGGRDP